MAPCETVEVGRLVVNGFGLLDQGIGLGIAKPKVCAQCCANGVALVAVEVSVHTRCLDQKRRRRKLRRLGLHRSGATHVGTAQ